MPLITYTPKNFRDSSLDLIQQSNRIVNDYRKQGFSLTLRQLYYQLVSRNVIPNNAKAYDNLGALINDARYAGLVDWLALEDRTRNLRNRSHWDSPAQIIAAVADQYHVNLWEGQPNYVEVWIEKDALVGVIEQTCHTWDLPHFSCRGYTSASEMWVAAQRIKEKTGVEDRDSRYKHAGAVILHLGDHDPSGIDMTRDIQDRLTVFEASVEVHRIALTIDQVQELRCPPNPAKITDSRASDYIARFGESSWELDALTPQYIVDLLTRHIEELVDMDEYQQQIAKRDKGRALLGSISNNLDTVTTLLERHGEL